MNFVEIEKLSGRIKENVEKVIVGKSDKIELIITALFANGHILLEDVPGTGKTVMAKAFAKSIGAGFKRVQFTPDLLPSDLTGINYFNQKEGKFIFRKGPIFTNILLGDEINRAMPRTQSSLLECMEERQVSIDGTTYKLDKPYFVMATQNPVEQQGTFPLPEAQMDRFIIRMNIGYPNAEQGEDILSRFINNDPLSELNSVCTKEEIIEASDECKNVFVHKDLQHYIISIAEETRKNSEVELGVSPRATLALLRASQVYAAIHGRNYVSPEDIKYLTPFVFCHRIILKDNIDESNLKNSNIIEKILQRVSVPTENWDGK